MSKRLNYIAVILWFFTINSSAQDSGFVGKGKPTSNPIKNKLQDASRDSIQHDSTAHVFGSYNFREDKDIPFRAKRQIHKGDIYFNLGPGKYDKAMKHYKKAFEIDPNIAYADFKVGQCYLLMRSSKFKSILYLEKAYHQNKHVDKEIHYYLGMAHQINQDYVRALEEYENSKSEYRKAHRKDHISAQEKKEHLELVDKKIEECKHAILFKEDPLKVMIENVGDSINSIFSDYDPFITADESMMVFTSRRAGTRGGGKAEIDHVYYEDLYVSYNNNGFWGLAKPMKNRFNKTTNDAIIGLSHDGLHMFVYRDTKHGDIYLCDWKEDKWTKPKAIREINTGYHESSACFSYNKKTIYFVSEKPGGYGGRDIYETHLSEDGKWMEPINIGGKINTKFDEERVYLHPNGKILYFCSQGHNSMGGYDIFSSEKDEDGKWMTPVNLGYPINSSDDDISFVITAEGDRGYFSSYRPKGRGDRDIYMIRFGISEKIGTLSREDDLLSKKKVLEENEFTAELIKMGIEPMPEEDVMPILPNETMEHLNEMIEQWDAEIAELLQLIDSTSSKKEILNLEKQVTVKREELALLQAAANPNEYTTLQQQVKLKQTEIDNLEAKLDSTSKKKEVKQLQADIAHKQDELALLQSAYVRSNEALASNDSLNQLNLSQTDSLKAISELNLNQNALVKATDSLQLNEIENLETTGASNSDQAQKDEVVLVLADNQYTAYTQEELLAKKNDLTELIASENLTIEDLQNQLENETDPVKKAEIQAQIELKQEALVDANEELIAYQQAKTITQLSNDESLSSGEKMEALQAVENRNLEIVENTSNTSSTGGTNSPTILENQVVETTEIKTESNISITQPQIAGNSTSTDINSETTQNTALNLSENQVAESSSVRTETNMAITPSKNENSAMETTVSDDDLNLVMIGDNYVAYSNEELESRTSELSSQVTRKNMELNQLKKQLAMATTEEQQLKIEQEIKTKSTELVVVNNEMDALLNASNLAEKLDDGSLKSTEVEQITNAAEVAKIRLTQTATVSSSSLENQVVATNNTQNNEVIESSSSVATTEINGKSNSDTGKNDNTSGSTSSAQNIDSNLGAGSSIVLENVFFDFDKSTLRPESFETLDKLVVIMSQPPASSQVELSGHTDSKGPSEYNQQLSEQRAKAVVDYLISKGVQKDRLIAKGYGEGRPSAPNSFPNGLDNPEGRQLNRRTELKILK